MFCDVGARVYTYFSSLFLFGFAERTFFRGYWDFFVEHNAFSRAWFGCSLLVPIFRIYLHPSALMGLLLFVDVAIFWFSV